MKTCHVRSYVVPEHVCARVAMLARAGIEEMCARTCMRARVCVRRDDLLYTPGSAKAAAFC